LVYSRANSRICPTFLGKTSGLKFNVDRGHYRLHDAKVKEANIAYKEDFLEKKLITANGFTITQKHPGYRLDGINNEALDFQDILVFKKN